MAIIGRLVPQNKYLGNHIGYLLVHCLNPIDWTMDYLSIGTPPLPDTSNSASVLYCNVTVSTVPPSTLQEAAKKLTFLDSVKINNVQMLDVKTNTLSNIMETNMPQTIIGSLIFYDGRCNHSKNVIFKVQLSSGIFYYYVDSTGCVSKLSRNVYVNRKAKVPEFVINCGNLYSILTTSGIIEIV